MSYSPSRGALLGQDLTTSEPVVIDHASRTRHVSIIGRTGYGKTTALEHLILEDINAGTSAIVIDPHGDLSQRIITLASEDQRQRITLLEVWPERPFRLNLLACADPTQLDRTVDDILTLFHRLFDTGDVQIGHRLHRYFGNALRTLIPNGGTLADVQRLFAEPEFRAAMLANVPNRKVREFWQLYDQIPEKERFNQLESTINRLDEFLSSETALAMVSSAHTTAPLGDVLNQDGQTLLIRIPIGELGEQQARFYGSLFLSLLTDQLFARANLSASARHRLHLYLDEYGWFATGTTAALLQQARKYNLGATIAFQTLADLPDAKNEQAALQVGTFIVLRLTGQNADELVSAFPVVPQRETISESIGFRQVTSVSPAPVDHLVSSGHSNDVVRAAVQAVLKQLVTDVEELKASPTRRSFADIFGPLADDPLMQAYDLLGRLLVSVMELQQDIGHEPHALMLADVFGHLGSRYPCDIGPSGNEALRTPEMQTRLARYFQQAAREANPRAYFGKIRHGTNTVWTWLTARAYDYYDEVLAGHQQPSLPYDASVYSRHDVQKDQRHGYSIREQDEFMAQFSANNDHRAREFCEERKAGHRRAISVYADQIEADAAHLILLCRVLATEPILVPTGQEREEYRGRVHLQTFADARIQLSGILANLRAYTAYYQMGSELGQVALSEPINSGYVDEEAIERVRERSKALYGVPLAPPDDNPPEAYAEPSEPPRPPGPRVTRRPRQSDNKE